ncbi:MAG: hypothetical protein V1861_06860 [Candidatus Micrarchaeota archaeon]
MTQPGGQVPRRADPFEQAFRLVDRSERTGGGFHFGAVRQTPHNGIDLFVPEGIPIQVPAHRAVLIGTTRESSPAGRSMGNALIFFIPNEGRPYFVSLLHLSPRTFQLLRRERISIGTEVEMRPGGEGSPVAVTGRSATGASGPHVHVSATTEFQFGGRSYSADSFMEMHQRGELGAYLRGKNFFALMPAARYRDPSSLAGYLNPADLIRQGALRMSSQPSPVLVARDVERAQSALIR